MTETDSRAILADMIDDKRGKRVASTLYDYDRYVGMFLDHVDPDNERPITDLHRDDLDRFIGWLLTDDETDYANSTILYIYNCVRAYLTYAYEEKLIRDNPARRFDIFEYKKISRNKTIKSEYTNREGGVVFVDADEVRQLINNVPEPRTRNQVLIAWLFETGMRASEIVRVRKTNVSEKNQRIRIKTSKRDNHKRSVYYRSQDLYELWKVDREAMLLSDTPYVFVSNRTGEDGSHGISAHAVNEVVKKAADNAGIQEIIGHDADDNPIRRVTAHTLRHGFGVHCVRSKGAADSGMDIRTLQLLMGHESIRTTEVYLQFREEYIAEQHEVHAPTAF